MSGPDWYRWYPAKWASGVIGLSPEQRGIYMDVINIILDRGSCPEDYAYLAKACNCRADKVRRIVQSLIDLGKLHRGTGELLQKKAQREREDSEMFAELQAKRARSRWGKVRKNKHIDNAISGTAISGDAITTTDSPLNTLTSESKIPDSENHNTPHQAGNGKKPPPEKGTRLREDWKPSEAAIAYCRNELGCSTEILNREYAAFMDWGLSATGPPSRKRNWDRAFVNWMRRVMNGIREQEARERRRAEIWRQTH